MLTLICIQNSSAHQVWPRIPYTHLRIRSLRDQASRSDPIRSSESDDAIPDPDPDPNHDSTVQLKKYFRAWRDVSFSSHSFDKFEALMDFLGRVRLRRSLG